MLRNLTNAAACRSLKSCWNTISFLKCGNRYAEALTVYTKIRSFKHEPFFFAGAGGGGGGGGWGTCSCMVLYGNQHGEGVGR